MMENLRKRTRVELVHTEKKLKKLVAKPTFNRFTIFNEELTAVHMKKVQLTLNRPTYVGFCILDLSKTLMYDFHYNYMKAKYGNRLKLLFTDTDSLCYHINTENIYTDWIDAKGLYDFSEHPPDHRLYDTANKKVIGKMKDETAGVPVEEFVGLRPKMYSMKFDNQEKKTAKGISKHVIKQTLRHNSYRECLLNQTTTMVNMHLIRSFKHKIYSVCVNKLGHSPFDDKRYVTLNGYDTFAHGHYRVMLENKF